MKVSALPGSLTVMVCCQGLPSLAGSLLPHSTTGGAFVTVTASSF